MAKPLAFYNEIDPFAARVLRSLIARGEIMPGDVNEKSIEDLTPSDLEGYTQHHFFAGFGVWSYALRRAGWPDWRPVATCSCPCQPLSSAGKGLGFADERHLWPSFYHLAIQYGFERIYGEQVASSLAETWIDLVHADLEAMDYAFGCVPFPSAGVGAPHIRDRNYWLAYPKGLHSRSGFRNTESRERGLAIACDDDDAAGVLANPLCDGTEYGPGNSVGAQAALDSSNGGISGERLRARLEGSACGLGDDDDTRLSEQQCVSGILREKSDTRSRETFERTGGATRRISPAPPGWLANTGGKRSAVRLSEAEQWQEGLSGKYDDRRHQQFGKQAPFAPSSRAGPVNGFWRAVDWLLCRDGKWRPVEPGTFPLAHGAPARVGRLRGYGNAINAEQAAAFIAATMDAPYELGLDLV